MRRRVVVVVLYYIIEKKEKEEKAIESELRRPRSNVGRSTIHKRLFNLISLRSSTVGDKMASRKRHHHQRNRFSVQRSGI